MKIILNQQGFAPIILILLILLASGGIVGGTLLVKNSYPGISRDSVNSLNLKQSEKASSSSANLILKPDKQTEKINNDQKSNSIKNIDNQDKKIEGFTQQSPQFQNKFIFKDFKENNLHTIDSDGNNPASLNLPAFLFEHKFETLASPNSQYLLIRTLNPKESKNLLDDIVYAFQTSKYYIYSIYENKLTEIPTAKILATLAPSQIILPLGWSYDSKKLIFTNTSNIINQLVPTAIKIAEYDFLTEQSSLLFSKDKGFFKFLFYDSLRKILIYEGDNNRFIRILNTDAEKAIPIPGYLNKYYIGSADNGGLYYATRPKQDPSKSKVQIFSLQEPEKLIGEIEINNTNNAYIERVVWSSGYNRMALIVRYSNEGGKTYTRNSSIHFFNLKGNQITSIELDDFHTKDGEPYIEGIYESMFSPDGKYFMLTTYFNTPYTWYVFDIENKKLLSKFSNERLNIRPLAWY